MAVGASCIMHRVLVPTLESCRVPFFAQYSGEKKEVNHAPMHRFSRRNDQTSECTVSP